MHKLFTTQSNNLSTNPPLFSPLPSLPSHSHSQLPSSSSKISPVVLLIIVILAIVFFISGMLHLLVRFLMKRSSFYSSVSDHSTRHPAETQNSETLQRQLQQLFRLHDSGLDQALIDALPVFYYKDIMGLKEPFDCAVCLCEFSDQDKLRLLPLCSHAFHISCIDTWLLSNSTCPLCRGSLLSSGLENQEFSLDYWREISFGCSIDNDCGSICNSTRYNTGHGASFRQVKPTLMEENPAERRVFSVRLGKFRSSNGGDESDEKRKDSGGETSTSSSCNNSSQIDGRRCYSLGSCQYVLAESNLQVALSSDDIGGANGDCDDANVGVKVEKMMEQSENCMVDGDLEGKKISRRTRGDSFSVSKIWLWSKKGKFTGYPGTNGGAGGGPRPLNVVLPVSCSDQVLP